MPVCVAVVTLVAAGLVAVRVMSSARATSGGDPYSVPSVVDVNPAPDVVETTIVARHATVDVGNGVMAQAMTFNGAIPGPEFRVNVGDTLIVHFENELAEGTGIHWHGIELRNQSDGTPLTQNPVPPGGSFLYRFQVPRPGVFWYHPHGHASINQVFRGMYGSLIVADPHEAAVVAAGAIPGQDATRTLMLADTTVCKAPGQNDTRTYDPSLPWLGTSPLPNQPGPTPADLCETPIDNDGNPIVDEGGEPAPLAAESIPNIQPADHTARVNEGQTVLTNGRNVGGRSGRPAAPGALAPGASTVQVRPGQGLRLRLVNAATMRYFRLHLSTASGQQVPLVRVGGEGGLLDNALVEGGSPGGFNTQYATGEIVIAPGDRAEVVAAIPASASGVATMWTVDFFHTGGGFTSVPTVPVMHLDVSGPPEGYAIDAGTPVLAAVGASVEALGPPTASPLDPATFTTAKPGSANPNVRLTNTFGFSIDDVPGIHDAADYLAVPHMASTRYARLGDLLELSVSNATSNNHPFHLHGFSIQPLRLTRTGSPTYTFDYREFVDEIDIPPSYTLTFRVRVDDRPLLDGSPGGGLGRWIFHCHLFFHNMAGMTSELVVVKDATGNEKPYLDPAATRAFSVVGGTASMSGTYQDLDGDPVTFAASPGSIVDNSNGTWTWSFSPTATDHGRTVVVTATDTAANMADAAFDLAVGRPTPPPADFDGNGNTDVGVFRPSAGAWFVQGAPAVQWGTDGDIAAPADYNGDGTTEIAVFRPYFGTWFVKDGPAVAWGADGDVPVPADYDGNGTADIAVFRPSTGTWLVKDGPAITWGTDGDVPVPADYDGDGRADMAVFRPTTGSWFVQGGPGVGWGTDGDIPVQGDYDGDGTADIAVFRPSSGIWFVQDGPAVHWGTDGDVPAPGDYDGDGRTELAVLRPSTGTWYVHKGAVTTYGVAGDVPLPLAPAVHQAWFA